MISMMETLNCTTTKTFRGMAAKGPALNVPFKTFTGLKEERYNAG